MKSGLTRRSLLARLGASALLGNGALGACGDNWAGPCTPDEWTFRAGFSVAVFEVTSNGCIVTVSAPSDMDVVVEVLADGVCEEGPRALRLLPTAGGSALGALEIGSLRADWEHDCVVYLPSGETIGPVRFKTAPPSTTASPVSFLVGADIGPDAEFYSVFDVMLEHRPNFYINLGDWPYADKAPAALSSAEFHRRHVAARADPTIQRFLASCPVFAVYDDHDVTNNWDGASNRDLVDAGVAAWTDWFPQRAPRQYRSWQWGSLAEFFMLDTRLYRSPNDAPDGPAKTMLGELQKAWLKISLSLSTAPFKFVLTSVPLDFGNSSDDWTAFAFERDEILNHILSNGIEGVTFLTADRHWFAAHHFESGIREYQFGPVAAGLGSPPDRFPPEVVAFHLTRNYGLIRIEAGEAPVLTIEARDEVGNLLYRDRL